jgi:hypothetical protein
MIQIGAGQTQRAFLFDQRDPGFGTEIFAALAADGLTGRNKNFESFGRAWLQGHKRFQELLITMEAIKGFIPNSHSASFFAPADEFIQSLDE